MRFQMLGPLRVWDGAAWSEIRAPQPRVVLAVLLAEACRPVTVDRLVDEIWGERPPRAAVSTLQVYVTRLRRLIGGSSLLTRVRAYELDVDEGDVDARLFDRLTSSGRQAMTDGDVGAAADQLSEALALWRGAALADVPASPTVTAQATLLEQARLDAVEERLRALLVLGRSTEAVVEARRLVHEHPLREPLSEHLMLALYRCGRRKEALDAYQQVRGALVTELGVEPGPRLRQLHQAVLADDPELAIHVADMSPAVGRPVPAQLPPDIGCFTGRAAQLHELGAMVSKGGASHPSLAIATITGPAGVGKTALAVHLAHQMRRRFSDGQLYVDLRGYAAGPPLRPIDALAGFLTALGVSAKDVPTDDEQASAMYRSLLADKCMLVLLDNAHAGDQVRPLLPGSAGCLVLVTSRKRLSGLVARDGATLFALGVLTPDEAHLLLARLLGPDRVAEQEAAIAEVAHQCAYLPLALRIAAANVTTRPHATVADLTVALAAGDRLSALQVDEDPEAAVRVAFDRSYTALKPDTRRLFRLLGLVPGPDVTVPTVAALADIDVGLARQLLDQLAAVAHLVDEPSPGRYSLHDLLRYYAADRCGAEDRQDGRDAALDRIHAHYLHSVDAAARLLYPQMLRLPVPPDRADLAVGFDDDVHALAWLDDECANLVATVRQAAERGSRSAAWRLADAMRGYLYLRMRAVDWHAVAMAGLHAAEADGELSGQAAAHLSLASSHWARGGYGQAITHYTIALDLSRRAGWIEGESTALGNLGSAHCDSGDLVTGVAYTMQALALDRQTGSIGGQATRLTNLGLVHVDLGQLDVAVDELTEALALHRRIGSPSGEARTLANLGEALHLQGRLDDALATLAQALALQRAVGDRHTEADTIRVLAEVNRDAGRLAEAHDLTGEALTAARQTGERRVEACVLTARASVDHHLGRYELAIEGHRQALGLAREIGERLLATQAQIGLGIALHRAGQRGEDATHVRAALATAHTNGYRILAGKALTVMAAIDVDCGRHEDAIRHADEAIAVHEATGHRLDQARTHLVASHALRGLGRDRKAQNHEKRAHRLFTQIGADPSQQAAALTAVREASPATAARRQAGG